jgi:hypothetical protein
VFDMEFNARVRIALNLRLQKCQRRIRWRSIRAFLSSQFCDGFQNLRAVDDVVFKIF